MANLQQMSKEIFNLKDEWDKKKFEEKKFEEKKFNEEQNNAEMRRALDEIAIDLYLLEEFLIAEREEEHEKRLLEEEHRQEEEKRIQQQAAALTDAPKLSKPILAPVLSKEEKQAKEKLTENFTQLSTQWQQTQQTQAQQFVNQMMANNVVFIGANGKVIKPTPQFQQQLVAANTNSNLPQTVLRVMNSHQQTNTAPVLTPKNVAERSSLKKELETFLVMYKHDNASDHLKASDFLRMIMRFRASNRLHPVNFKQYQPSEEIQIKDIMENAAKLGPQGNLKPNDSRTPKPTILPFGSK